MCLQKDYQHVEYQIIIYTLFQMEKEMSSEIYFEILDDLLIELHIDLLNRK